LIFKFSVLEDIYYNLIIFSIFL